MNNFSNLIPKKLVTFNDKDPPWMAPNLRNKINCKNGIYKEYIKNGNTNYHYLQLQNAISEGSVAISRWKDDYHSRLAQKLSDPNASSKTYWSVLKRFLNGKKYQLFHPSRSIINWNQTLKFKLTILTVPLLQNVLHLLTTVPYLIH